jgi:hypothetical protein
MVCRTREELIAEYESAYDGKIPESLSPAARDYFEEELARIEGRDDFKIVIHYPDWLPEEGKQHLYAQFNEILNSVAWNIFNDARVKYKPGHAKVGGTESREAVAMGAMNDLASKDSIEIVKFATTGEPSVVNLVSNITGIKLSTTLELDGEVNEYGRAGVGWDLAGFFDHR